MGLYVGRRFRFQALGRRNREREIPTWTVGVRGVEQVDMFRSRSRDGLGLSLRVAGRLASPFGFPCVPQDELSCRSGEC